MFRSDTKRTENICHHPVPVMFLSKRAVKRETILKKSIEVKRFIQESKQRECAYSFALDESTDKTDTAQLAEYVRGVGDNF